MLLSIEANSDPDPIPHENRKTCHASIYFNDSSVQEVMVNELLEGALDAESASSFQQRYRPVSYCLTGPVRALRTAPAASGTTRTC